MRLRELLYPFFQGFFRWMGAALALFFFFAFLTTLATSSERPKIRALPVQGFEVTPWKGQPAIALVRIEGEIGTRQLNRERVRQVLEACQEGTVKGKIKALLLEINSGGGASDDSEAIYQLIKSYKQLYQIPVYAHIDGVCASGAFMIACAADAIFATSYSTLGSVGVVARSINYSGTLERLGMQAQIFQRGEGKAALNPALPVNQQDRLFLEPLIESTYQRFLNIVASSRPLLSEKRMREELGARIFAADQAQSLGYIDQADIDRASAVVALAAQAHLESGFALLELSPAHHWSDLLSSEEIWRQLSESLGSLQPRLALSLS